MIETENDKQDVIVLLTNRLVDQTCRLMALAKEKQTNIEGVIYVDHDGNDAVAYVYDYTTKKMTSAATFDKMAQEAYGDPSLGTVIAYYNKIQNEHAVAAGTTIKIPVLARQDQNLNNRIYAPPDLQDNYGRDIAVLEDGGFAVERGDFAVVQGPQNLHQAVGNRLTTASEKRIRIGAYGLRNSTGDPIGIDSYLLASIEQTLKEEPRIAKIEDIQFTGERDALHITIVYQDINGNQDTYTGEV